VEVGVVPKDLHDSMKDRSSWGLRGLIVLPGDEYMTTNCPGRGVEDVRGHIAGLTVIAEHPYSDAKELSASLSFFVAVVGFVTGVKHRDGSYDVCGVHCCSLYLSESILIGRGECGLATERGVVGVIVGGRHKRMIFHSRSFLLLTVWTSPP
jgi:hypothetical protein